MPSVSSLTLWSQSVCLWTSRRARHDSGSELTGTRMSRLLNVLLSSTKMILHRLLMYSITRGILIILVQVGHIVMYVVDPSNVLFWWVLWYCDFKVCVNLFLQEIVTSHVEQTVRYHDKYVWRPLHKVPFPDSLIDDPWFQWSCKFRIQVDTCTRLMLPSLNSRSSRREKLDEMVILDPSLLSLALSLSTVPSTADVGAHPNL